MPAAAFPRSRTFRPCALAAFLSVAAASASLASPLPGLNHPERAGILSGRLGQQLIVACVERGGRVAYYRTADAVEHALVADGDDWLETVGGTPTHRWIGNSHGDGRRVDLATGEAVEFRLGRWFGTERIAAPCASAMYTPQVAAPADARVTVGGPGAAGTRLPIARSALATARDRSFVVTANGELWAWGQNRFGELGDGTEQQKAAPVRLGVGFASVFAGPGSVVAIKRDGSLWSWGERRYANTTRELARGGSGFGTGISYETPMIRRIGEGFVHASVASLQSGVVAVGQDGSLWAEYTSAVHPIPPSKGRETEYAMDPPRLVRVGDGFRRALVWEGSGGTCVLGLKSDGTLLSWGRDPTWPRDHPFNADRPSRVDDGFVDLVEGYVAIKADGSRWRIRPQVWPADRRNSREEVTCHAKAARIEDPPGALDVKVLRSTPSGQSIAIDRDGGLWAWGTGYPDSAPLGDGASAPRPQPVRIGERFVDVSAQGAQHRVALRRDGTVWFWGDHFESWSNRVWRYQPPWTVAPPTVVGRKLRAVAAGGRHALALGEDGRVRAWGYNGAGQVGLDPDTAVVSRPVRLLGGVTSVAAGAAHSLALRRDGTLLGWGANDCGQLGRPDPAAASHRPVILARRIERIAAGISASYAIAADGTLWRWGVEDFQCLAGGWRPWAGFGRPAKLGTGFAEVFADHGAVLLVDREGAWWELDEAWRRDAPPLRALGRHGHARIVKVRSTYFGLRSDGTLHAWGRRSHPALPDAQPDEPVDATVSVEMGHGHAAIAVSAGYALSVGRDGSVHAWGDVSGHPVGPARDASQGGGAPLPIGSDFFSVAAGDRVSFAIRADGTLLGWGDTTVGQAGVGRAIPFKPVRVVLARRGDAAGRSSAAKASPPR